MSDDRLSPGMDWFGMISEFVVEDIENQITHFILDNSTAL